MTVPAAHSEPFEDALRRVSLSALWARDVYPRRREQPRLWRWSSVEPLLAEAVRQTDMANAERRVLTLVNHDVFGSADFVSTTTNLSANFQILMPGERAPAHRHPMNALRLVVEGAGATTLVDGKPCPMQERDLILTPGWCWHEHSNEGAARVIWLDLLDAPLIRQFDLVRFERMRTADPPPLPADAAFAAAGFLPDALPAHGRHSPLFRYSWSAATAALAAAPRRTDGARLVRYVDVATGGPVMNLIDCFLLEIPAGRRTHGYRTSSNAIAFVLEGAGRSQVGETQLAWSRNDVFTLPHEHWITHEAQECDAILFIGTDREILRRLDLLRDELAP
jgi:gentisate 1,2-dioxygenase